MSKIDFYATRAERSSVCWFTLNRCSTGQVCRKSCFSKVVGMQVAFDEISILILFQ